MLLEFERVVAAHMILLVRIYERAVFFSLASRPPVSAIVMQDLL